MRLQACPQRRLRHRAHDSVDVWPSFRTTIVGMLMASNRMARPWLSSTLTLTTLTRPACSRANASSIGLTIRHGPHHGAHRSMTTVGAAAVLDLEGRLVCVDHPGEWLPARPAVGRAAGARADPVGGAQLGQVRIETGPGLVDVSDRLSGVIGTRASLLLGRP